MEKTLKQSHSSCLKIVLFGPESTGKTSLAKDLAKHYNTLWVPEFSRLYAEKNKPLSVSDVMPIAYGQMQLENDYVQNTKSLLFYDTNLLQTKVYANHYYPDTHFELLEKYALKNQYDFYLLTATDFPWQPDGIRENTPNERELLFRKFETILQINNLPYITLNGGFKQRFNNAVKIINALI